MSISVCKGTAGVRWDLLRSAGICRVGYGLLGSARVCKGLLWSAALLKSAGD